MFKFYQHAGFFYIVNMTKDYMYIPELETNKFALIYLLTSLLTIVINYAIILNLNKNMDIERYLFTWFTRPRIVYSILKFDRSESL